MPRIKIYVHGLYLRVLVVNVIEKISFKIAQTEELLKMGTFTALHMCELG